MHRRRAGTAFARNEHGAPGSLSASRYRPSSEPGMSGAWSKQEVHKLVDAVEQFKAKFVSICGALMWESLCLPHRTTKACELRYSMYIRHKHEQDADDARCG